ncbi:hypothetical protein MQE36_15950 [Zhouia spongiae]|uniref:SusE outer membrane protein domain-containing protein n=1 Tax=Zhouia spongiae TaxID=2202721 RepID=A0ABY3YLR9_9FLAO|nr:hypothetical protein [Zhouia spongiae]UNY98560.1 hypothetical protein MQE36_15950 [Zhouia spongiae]
MNKYILIILCVSIFSFQACDDVEEIIVPDASNISWVTTANLEFTAQGDESSFIYNVNKSTGEEFWGVSELTFDVAFQSNGAMASDISKIDIYAFIEEEVNDSYNYLGGDSGKLITTINNPGEMFQITVTKDMLYDLYQGDFLSSRTEIKPGDLFEFKWVITGKDGTVFDSRENCSGFNCTFGFLAEFKIVDTWLGEFEATWVEVGPGTITYSYTGVVVGAKRTVIFTPGEEEGYYDVDDMAFGGAYSGPRGGTLTYDAESNILTRVAVETYYESNWEVVSITPEVLTIKWTNNFTDLYGEYGTVELTRTDGLSWPVGVTIVNN